MPTRPPSHRPTGHRTPQQRQQAADAQRPGARQRGYTHRWELARRDWLREHPTCVRCEAEGRIEFATVVDHIIPHRGDEILFWDRANWQSLCESHHNRKTLMEDGKLERPGPIALAPCTIVWGPPGSGKSTYVQQHAQVNDLIIDLDTLWHAVTVGAHYQRPTALLPYVLAARDAMIDLLASDASRPASWIIGILPKREDRQRLQTHLSAQMVFVDVPQEECLRRIRSDTQRHALQPQRLEFARRWFAAYEPDEKPGDEG